MALGGLKVGLGFAVLSEGQDGGCLNPFYSRLSYFACSFTPPRLFSLLEMARYTCALN